MDSEKKTVLIIDDQKEIRELITRTLRDSEFQVIEAENGRDGIIAARDQKPHIILLDVMMPKFDGYMTCSILKRNPSTKDIPVIFLTARKTKEDIQKALKAGGADYVMKPFDPSDLMTRLRRVYESHVVRNENRMKSKQLSKNDSVTEKTKKKVVESLMNFKKYGDVMVFATSLGTIDLDNCQIFRDVFANFVSDEIFKVVIDVRNINYFDNAGLGLLISLNESLSKYGGGVRITFPQKEVNTRFTFIRLTDLFQSFHNLQEAIESFQEQDGNSEQIEKFDELNICMSCTFVNAQKARYCSFCGTNLVLGKGDEVLKVLTKSMVRRIISEANTTDINEINKARDIKVGDYKIPSKFLVEINDKDLSISYQSNNTDSKNVDKTNQIEIDAPVIGKTRLPLMVGMSLSLANPQTGSYSKFKTQIEDIDIKNGKLKVRYDSEAISLLSKKNFSVAPKIPIPVSLIVPTLKGAGEIFNAKILEISRVRMVVFSEENIPLEQCMAVSFTLDDYGEISSPLVIAQKGRQRFMYDIEFKVVDGKESTKIIQYMYKRQIELVKGKRT